MRILPENLCGGKVRERVQERALGFADEAARADDRARLLELVDIFKAACEVIFKNNFEFSQYRSSIRASSPSGKKMLTVTIISGLERFRLEKQICVNGKWRSFIREGFSAVKEELEKYAQPQKDS